MKGTDLLMVVPLEAEQAIAYIHKQLSAESFQVIRSFELPSVCAITSSLICQHTGVTPCPCQLNIFTVIHVSGEKTVLLLHTYESQTEIIIVDEPNTLGHPEINILIKYALMIDLPKKSRIR